MSNISNLIKSHRLETYDRIKNKKLIYLDTKFGLKLRNQNIETDTNKRKFLNRIIELSDSDKCIFPISETLFLEFFKQEDINTLKATLNLVGKLSKGVSMISLDERRKLEFRHFYYNKLNLDTHELKELIWQLPYEQKMQSDDFIAKFKTDDIKDEQFNYKDDIEMLNDGKFSHAHENKTYKDMFLSELHGHLQYYQNVFNEVIYEEYCKNNNKVSSIEESDSLKAKDTFVNLIFEGFKQEKLTTELPVFRVISELFASVRWNKDRKFKDGNDLMDFMHASYALPYCDYFFTENELKTIITQTKLNELYDCVVESTEEEILKVLKSL